MCWDGEALLEPGSPFNLYLTTCYCNFYTVDHILVFCCVLLISHLFLIYLYFESLELQSSAVSFYTWV